MLSRGRARGCPVSQVLFAGNPLYGVAYVDASAYAQKMLFNKLNLFYHAMRVLGTVVE